LRASMTRAASPPEAVAASGRSGSAGPADSRKVTLSRPDADSRNRPLLLLLLLLLSPARASLLLLLPDEPVLSGAVSRGCGCSEVGASTAREDGPAWQLTAAEAAAAAAKVQTADQCMTLLNINMQNMTSTCAFCTAPTCMSVWAVHILQTHIAAYKLQNGDAHAPGRVPAQPGMTRVHKAALVSNGTQPIRASQHTTWLHHKALPTPATLPTCCSACPAGVQLMSTANLLLPMASCDRQPCTAWASAPAAARRACDSASAAVLMSDCRAAASARHASAWPAGRSCAGWTRRSGAVPLHTRFTANCRVSSAEC
jgi:hypothetical protein